MSNPTIPVAPGERVTVVTSRPLYFNRYVGHATRRQNERQAIGGDDVPVTLIAVGRTRSSRPATGTLEADGHVGVAPGLVVQLYDLTLDVVDQSLPSATTDAGIEARLDALGYGLGAYAGSADAQVRRVYDFQVDHDIAASGRLDAATRDAIVAAFGE